jgi:hypothetical protein
MEDPEMVRVQLFLDAELNIVHDVNSHQRRWVEVELGIVGVLRTRHEQIQELGG